MPIEIRELRIKVAVDQPTSEARAGKAEFKEFTVKKQTDKPMTDDGSFDPADFFAAGETAASDPGAGDVFSFRQSDHAGTSGDAQFRAVAQDDAFHNGDGSVRFMRGSIDGGVFVGDGDACDDDGRGGVDLATSANDHPDFLVGTYGRGVLVIALDDIELYKAHAFGDFDLM